MKTNGKVPFTMLVAAARSSRIRIRAGFNSHNGQKRVSAELVPSTLPAMRGLGNDRITFRPVS